MTVIHLNDENFDQEIKQSKTPIILDFWAPWCGPCQMMGPVFEKLSESYKGKLKFAKVNTDENPDIAQKFEVSGIPCLVLVKDSKEIDRIVGFSPEAQLKQKIDSILKNS